MDKAVYQELLSKADKTRVFLSMPYIKGVSPLCLDQAQADAVIDAKTGIERRSGVFRLNEAGLSCLDHGGLYGDAVFEGIRIDKRRVWLLKEHIQRLIESAKLLDIVVPYSREELVEIILQLSKEAMGYAEQNAYLRPIVTRGLGDLGINPKKCLAPTVYIICSTISLYPAETYADGIDLAIARHIRRNHQRNLDPRAKTNNYLNNILALIETQKTGCLETLMLTDEGYVAEATADNIFLIDAKAAVPCLRYPAAHYALVGLTRNTVIDCARELGFDCVEDPCILPSDLTGEHKEVFMTGTAAGIMPIRSIDGLACAGERPHTKRLMEMLALRMTKENAALSIDADADAKKQYIESPFEINLKV